MQGRGGLSRHALLYIVQRVSASATREGLLGMNFKAAAAPLLPAPAGGPKLAYAWRPLLPDGCTAGSGSCSSLGTQGRLVVPGYGVELAIKNMEYNARDDSQKVGAL